MGSGGRSGGHAAATDLRLHGAQPAGRVLKMEDMAGPDAKIIGVPIAALTSAYQQANSFRDLPRELLDRIANFFAHYKDLEPGKRVKIAG